MTTTQLSAMTDAQLTDLEVLTQDLNNMIDTDALTYEYTTDVISHELIEETIELTEMLLNSLDDSNRTGLDSYLMNPQRRLKTIETHQRHTVKHLKSLISATMKVNYKWKKQELILVLMHLANAGLDRAGHLNLVMSPSK